MATTLFDSILNFKVTDDLPFMDYKYPLFGALGYLFVMYGLKHLIHLSTGKSVDPKHKSGAIVRFFTQVHNIIMIALSFTMFIGVIHGAYVRVMFTEAKGSIFRGLFCPKDVAPGEEPVALNGPIGFWIYVFHLSKYYELFDTLLLVIKRKQLIFLHVYHHSAMVVCTWLWLHDRWLIGAWWGVLVNSLVHTFMYYYYYIAANGRTVSWKSIMTAGQIIQLWSGFLLVCYWFYIRNTESCKQGYYAGMLSHIGNSVLIYQFCAFYVKQYLSGPSSKKKGDVAGNKKSVEQVKQE